MYFVNIWRNLPPVTKNLIIINFLVWAMINLLGSRFEGAVLHYGALHYFTSSDFVPSELFTYMFMHQGFMHLFFNMFALFMFGGIIERTIGPARYIFFYVSCGLGAALIQEGVYALMINHIANLIDSPMIVDTVAREGASLLRENLNYSDPTLGRLNVLINVPTLGASGAIYGVLLAFGFLYPRQPIYLMFIPVPIQARWMVLGYGVIELMQTLNYSPSDNVAHLAHLGGMIFGLVILLYWKHKNVVTPRNF